MKHILRTLAAFALSVIVLAGAHEVVIADGPYFHRIITQSVEFRQDESTLPAAGTAYIARDGSGELTINVLTGQSVNFAVNAVDIFSLALAGIDMSGNSIDNAGFLILNADTAPAGTEVYLVRDNTNDLTLNALTSGAINLAVNSVDIVAMDVAGFTMAGNSISGSGFITLTADTNPAGTNAYISRDNTDDVTVNVPTGGLVQVAVNGTDEVGFSATQVNFNGNELLDASILNMTDPTTLTVSATNDTIAVTQSYHLVTAVAGQTVDSVGTITGGANGDLLILGPADTDDIFIDVDGGNIQGTDRSLFEVGDRIFLIFDGSNWNEISFADNE